MRVFVCFFFAFCCWFIWLLVCCFVLFFKDGAAFLNVGIKDFSVTDTLWAAEDVNLSGRTCNLQGLRCHPGPFDPFQESSAG